MPQNLINKKTSLVQVNVAVNVMPADSLAPNVARISAGMILAVLDR